MVITHHGAQCFKVTFGDLTLVFDPISKKSTLAPVRFGADLALVSRNHPDANGIDEVTYGDTKPFAITGPGEYEYEGVVVQGFPTQGPGGSLNTMYAVGLEDMTLLHLGALAETELKEEAREGIGDVDILFIPIGGGPPSGKVLSPKEAHDLAASLEPKIIIPMHWSGVGAAKSLDAFLKEEGGADETLEKLTIRKKDAASREGDILVLTP